MISYRMGTKIRRYPSKLGLTSLYDGTLCFELRWRQLLNCFFLQTDITEDQTSPDQVRESFAGIARGKVSLMPNLDSANADSLYLLAVCDRARFAGGFDTSTDYRFPQDSHAGGGPSCGNDA